jgi:hypothetical protein
VEYLLPLKAGPDDDLTELGTYVRGLTAHLPVLVVDGSDERTFARNDELFAPATHVRPDPALHCANGKVAGVRTGFALCRSDRVVVADDDVRYEPEQLKCLDAMLDDADLVVPQNHYEPVPWPAQWDTARILINRALPSGDYPGTLALRLSPRLRTLGYDGDVLFENLELIRSVRADGGRVLVARDLFVRRLPPGRGHFAGQRVRQAYDSLAQPTRLAVELSLLPLAAWGLRHRWMWAALAAASTGIAAAGRQRAGGAAYFPRTAVALAPVWVAERAVCSWVAIARRARGGTPYAGQRLSRAASSTARLRRERARADGCRRRTA